MQLNPEQMTWLAKLSKTAKRQKENEKNDAKKNTILDKFAEQRDQNWDTILEGMQIKVGRIGDNGKFETMDVYREDGDATKTFDIDEQRQGWRVANDDGVEGGFDEDGNLVEQPELSKHTKAYHLLIQMTEEATNAKVTVTRKGKTVEKPLFTEEELTSELYDPLVRRGVPETFIGNKHSRTHALVKGSFKEYAKRLEKEDVKGFVAENKDLGISLFRLGIAIPGNVTNSISGVNQGVSQDQFTHVDVVGNYQQAYGLEGNKLDLMLETATTWNFVQNVSDIGFDGVYESKNTRGELKEAKQKVQEDEEDEDSKPDRAKAVPGLTRGVIASIALQIGGALAKIGPAGGTIFGGMVGPSKVAAILRRDPIKGADISELIELLADAIDATLTKLCPKKVDGAPLTEAAAAAKKALRKTIDADQVADDLQNGEYEKVITAIAAGAQEAGAKMAPKLTSFVKKNAKAMKGQAAKYVTEELKKAEEEDSKPEDKDHKKEKGHDPDWVQVEGKPACLRCQGDMKDVNLFAGMLEQKILDMKQDEAIFKMIVNIGGLGFDVASNFVAPMAMGGALLRMFQWSVKAVKKRKDFDNFCASKKAMINAASAYSASIRRFRADAAVQYAHATFNAACEGIKILAAILQCTPAAVGGIVMGQAASGAEALEAVIYEINKRDNLRVAWKTYKQALQNPDNRKLALIAMRRNPTLAKYAVAWGAVVAKDPLVGDFIAYCGINSDTLEGNANIDKVVDYLEARLPDDLTVVGRRPEGTTAEWALTKVRLTTDSWIDAKTRGETLGGVAKIETPAIESALINYTEAKKVLDKAKSRKGKEAKKEAVVKCLEKLRGALQAYFPKNAKSGGMVDEMSEVVELFLSKLETEIGALNA